MKTAKRLSAFFLTLALLFALAGCGTPAAELPPAWPADEETASDAAQNTPEPDAPALSEAGKQEDTPAAPEEELSPAEAPENVSSDAPDVPSESTVPLCTVSISCAALLDHTDELSPETAELIPPDGILLPPTQVALTDGESAFDVLRRVCRENSIHMEFSETPVYQSAYIEGIGNLYEFDCGSGSGWMYRVNGLFPNYGCSRYALADGDVLEWVYTCNYGADVGGDTATEAAA